MYELLSPPERRSCFLKRFFFLYRLIITSQYTCIWIRIDNPPFILTSPYLFRFAEFSNAPSSHLLSLLPRSFGTEEYRILSTGSCNLFLHTKKRDKLKVTIESACSLQDCSFYVQNNTKQRHIYGLREWGKCLDTKEIWKSIFRQPSHLHLLNFTFSVNRGVGNASWSHQYIKRYTQICQKFGSLENWIGKFKKKMLIHAFFISNSFLRSTRLKPARNQANAKQHPETELLLFDIYWHSCYHPKIVVDILQNKQKKKYACKNEEENEK